MRHILLPDAVYGADFETDNDGSKAWVCQWCISTGETETYGRSLDSFQKAICQLLWLNDYVCIYFHNLKYDAEFMKSALKGFENLGYAPRYTLRKGNPIALRLELGEKRIEFRDSMKKIPTSLKKVGKLIGVAKQESPRGFYRGWSEDIDYSEGSPDWCYIRIDARIVALAMRDYHRRGFDRSTMSGDAWQCLKIMMGDGKRHQHYPRFESLFPKIPLELDKILRKGYSGGQNYSANKGQNCGNINHEDVHNMYGGVIFNDPLPYGLPVWTDEQPQHATIWMVQCRIRFKLKDNRRPIWQFKNGLDYVIEDLPFGSIVDESMEWHDLMLTNIDLKTFSSFYEIECDPTYRNEYYVFKDAIGLLKPFMDQFTAIKESSPKQSIDYMSAKTMINAGAYGRFGLAPDGDTIKLLWDDDLKDWNWQSEYIATTELDSYVPWAIFVTAWARRHLLDNLAVIMDEHGADAPIHCDTDSVIHYGDPVETPKSRHGDHVGTWGIESRPEIIIEAGFKRYIELRQFPMQSMDDLIGIACAGVPQQWDYHETYPMGMWIELLDDPMLLLDDGHELGQAHYAIRSEWLRKLYADNGADPDDVDTRKLIPVRCPGGVILEPRTHKLNDNLSWRLRK